MPLAKLALPARPTEPTSPSDQTAGTVETVTAWTVREIAAEFVKLPEVPVTMTVTVPVVAVPLAVSVKVLEGGVLLGLKDALTPLGMPEAERLTLLLKPFCGVTARGLPPLAPRAMLRL